jgi:hypothetical protein
VLRYQKDMLTETRGRIVCLELIWWRLLQRRSLLILWLREAGSGVGEAFEYDSSRPPLTVSACYGGPNPCWKHHHRKLEITRNLSGRVMRMMSSLEMCR